MKYKNTNTGAVIDSPCIISGGDWMVYDVENNVIQAGQEDEAEEQNLEETQENDEAAELNKKEIIQELKALGIKFNPNANKKELYDLMMKGR